MVYLFAMQSVSGAKEILSLKEVTVVGILVLVVFALSSALVYMYKKSEKLTESRLEDHKEFTKEILSITDKTTNTVKQVNEILKITRGNVQ